MLLRPTRRKGGRTCRSDSGLAEEVAHDRNEPVELVVVHPVSSALDVLDANVLEIAGATVGSRIAGPALGAAEEECRAGDRLPQLSNVFDVHPEGAVRADVVVELPAVGAVFVLIDAMHREMAGLFG